MFIGFLLAFSVADQAWQKFQKNPTFTSLKLNLNELKTTYPTVSVCPEAAGDDRKVSVLIRKTGVTFNETYEIHEFLNAIPNFSYGTKGLRSIVLSESGKIFMNQLSIDDVRTLAFQLKKSCSDVLQPQTCIFKKKIIDCCQVFQPIFTERGFCYAFNSRVFGTLENDE